jgi:hypothetical protein
MHAVLLVLKRDTPTTSTLHDVGYMHPVHTVDGGKDTGYILHICPVGGDGYTLHVHNAGAVDGYTTLHVHNTGDGKGDTLHVYSGGSGKGIQPAHPHCDCGKR